MATSLVSVFRTSVNIMRTRHQCYSSSENHFSFSFSIYIISVTVFLSTQVHATYNYQH